MAIYGEVNKGDIVYAWDDHIEEAVLTHYVKHNGTMIDTSNVFCDHVCNSFTHVFTNIATPEEYHKLLNQHKDKDLVEAFNSELSFSRVTGFYDAKHDSLFFASGQRDGARFYNYRVIPKDQWPEWAHEAYPKLED